MIRFISILLFSWVVPLSAFAQASGTVRLAPDNTAMAGVIVTDGNEVVKTDSSGHFTLPAGEGTRFITITTPSGFRPAKQFFQQYTGKDAAYDFTLEKSPFAGQAFRFIQIADSELHTVASQNADRNGGWLDNVKDYVQENPTAFVMHTGDICYDAGLRFHAAEVNTRTVGTTMLYGIGNHDLVRGKYGEALYEDLFGPVWYSFDVGNVHFVMTPMLSGDYRPSYNSAQVIRWLKNDLAQIPQGKPVVVFNHDLWLAPDRTTFKASDGTVFDFANYNTKAWIYGHWHTHFQAPLGKSGIKSYCASTPDKGGIDHSPAAFRVYHVDEQGEIYSETRYTHLQNQLEAAVPEQAGEAVILEGKITVRANAYHTSSPTVSVQAALVQAGQPPQWTDLAADTDFAWSGAVKASPGKQTLWLKATLENGSVLNKKIEFTAVAPTGLAKPDANWPNLRGNAGHNMLVTKPATPALTLQWSANAGGNIFTNSPIVAEGKVYVATIDDDTSSRCAVVAFDAVTGKQVWRFKTGNSIKSSIAYDSGVVLAADAEGRLYAIDAGTGQARWTKKLNTPFLAPLDHGLVAENGVVYAGHQHGLSAITVADGKVVWDNKGKQGGEGTPATHTLGDGVLTVSSHWRALYAHDAATGKLLWEQATPELRFRDGPATFADGKFYLASKDSLIVLEAKTGKILQTEKTSLNLSAGAAPLVTDKKIIIGTAEQGLIAFDRQTLKESWRFATDGSLIYTVPYSNNHAASIEGSPVLVGDTVYFGAGDGSFYGVGLDDGRRRWAYKTGAPVFSSPAISGNMLYMADFSGNVYAFRLE